MASLPPDPYPCGFCGAPDRWPHECPGDPPDDFCSGEIDWRHGLGDHRRCSPECDGFALVAEVADRGGAFARAEGRRYAVVSTYDEPWRFRSFDHLRQAKPFRSRIGKAHGARWGFEFKSRVFVIRDDGCVI